MLAIRDSAIGCNGAARLAPTTPAPTRPSGTPAGADGLGACACAVAKYRVATEAWKRVAVATTPAFDALLFLPQ